MPTAHDENTLNDIKNRIDAHLVADIDHEKEKQSSNRNDPRIKHFD